MKKIHRPLYLFKLTSKLSPMFYVLIGIQAIVRTLKILVAVFGLKYIIDGLTSGDMNTAFKYALFVVLIECLLLLLELSVNTYIRISQNHLRQRVNQYLANQMMTLEFHYLEDPQYLDITAKTKYAIDNFGALSNYFTSIGQGLYHMFVLLSMITILVIFEPIILVILGLISLTNIFISKQSVKKQTGLFEELGPINRKHSYFSDAVTNVNYAKDYRMYPLEDLVYKKYTEHMNATSNHMVYFYKIIYRFRIYLGVLNLMQISLVYLYIGYQSIALSLGIATYVYLTAAVLNVSRAFEGVISSFTRIGESVNYLDPLFTLSKLETESKLYVGDDHIDDFNSLTFKNVTFSYPGSDDIILEDISFNIFKGDKVSIVGLNGAGKTTIVKLICRLYNPDSGTILWNGKNINSYNYKYYIKMVSVVFQDFKLLNLTLAENVDVEVKDISKIEKCIKEVGLEPVVNKLQDKLQSYYGKEYHKNGVILSGGEQQKVAIARAMYKPATLTILDEPTSALDPIAEAEIYKHFSTLVQDKTSIYISHRMSSSVFCNKIIVLNHGKIEKIDTHENLMGNKKSLYYELFNSQSQYYKKNVK